MEKENLKKEVQKCVCDEPQCAKCIGVNCQDDNCPIHTIEKKLAYRKRRSHTS